MKLRTKRKNAKNKRLELENLKYKEIIEQLRFKIKSDEYLKEENKKMINWVQKILEEFGTQEVSERKIQIPIIKHKDFMYGDDNMRYTTETIIIPEIIIHKGEY
ncbi:MAG: hypothetical protein IJ105_01330 [Bacilli bacterium]|nr:hypothetical protein [Bacilli bacterium]